MSTLRNRVWRVARLPEATEPISAELFRLVEEDVPEPGAGEGVAPLASGAAVSTAPVDPEREPPGSSAGPHETSHAIARSSVVRFIRFTTE